MRSLRQPGPAHPVRIDSIGGKPQALRFPLQRGQTLNQALTAPLVAAGFQSAAVTLCGAALAPFRYVMPNPSPDASHVAWFSATQAPEGTSRVELANATFGWSGGAPFVHCHAVWREPDGRRRGGHILPHETWIAEPAEAAAWGFRSIRIEALPDAETNFALFQPAGMSAPGASGVVVRIKPNQDIISAIETVADRHGMADATIRGSLGSLIGARFSDGTRVDDSATEVLVRHGTIRAGRASLDLLVVDMQGRVHEGWLTRGDNPVCITFDIVLQAAG